MALFTKDPDSVLDYGVNWAPWLAGDTIATSTWSVDNDDLVIDESTNNTTTTTVWVSAGTLGDTYKLVNHIVTAAGREDDRTLTILVRQR